MIALDYGLDVVELDDRVQCLITFVRSRSMIRCPSNLNDPLLDSLHRALHGDKA